MEKFGNFGQTMVSGLQYYIPQRGFPGGQNGSATFMSEPITCDGLVHRSNGVHTIQIKTIAFSGDIQFYATLDADPCSATYVPIYPTPSVANSAATLSFANISTNQFFTITGQFSWMKCSVNNIKQGAIEYIRVTY